MGILIYLSLTFPWQAQGGLHHKNITVKKQQEPLQYTIPLTQSKNIIKVISKEKPAYIIPSSGLYERPTVMVPGGLL